MINSQNEPSRMDYISLDDDVGKFQEASVLRRTYAIRF